MDSYTHIMKEFPKCPNCGYDNPAFYENHWIEVRGGETTGLCERCESGYHIQALVEITYSTKPLERD